MDGSPILYMIQLYRKQLWEQKSVSNLKNMFIYATAIMVTFTVYTSTQVHNWSVIDK